MVMVAIFSALVNRDAFEDSEKDEKEMLVQRSRTGLRM